MRTIGLLGGMSWESTTLYYQRLNLAVQAKFGAPHQPTLLLHSFDFAQIRALQEANKWDDAGQMLAQAALGLERAGAEAILICANTMHKVAPAVEAAISTPLIHLADVTAQTLRKHGITQAGLLGTRFVLEHDFYRDRLINGGVQPILPHTALVPEIDR
ncbi:MAG: amino acid racemase, partial [Alphaproteobacteria bacterium]|nr:amino acid racemase [Alphaproteobacteria bacterium]